MLERGEVPKHAAPFADLSLDILVLARGFRSDVQRSGPGLASRKRDKVKTWSV